MRNRPTESEEKFSAKSKKCSRCFCCRAYNSPKRTRDIRKLYQNTIVQEVQDEEHCDFLIEKLAIRRVPVRKFATKEDLINIPMPSNNTFEEKQIIKPKLMFNNPEVPATPISSKSYSQQSSVRERPQKNIRIRTDGKKKIEQEKEMVSHILHSLSTLEDKEPNTETMQKLRTMHNPQPKYSPPTRRNPQFAFESLKPEKKLVYAQVHKTEKVCEQEEGMTNELRDTIAALGAAQPLLNINQKNKQKAQHLPLILPPKQDNSCETLVEDDSQELRCIALDNDVDLILHKCENHHHNHSHKPLPTVLPKQDTPPKELPRFFLAKQNNNVPVHKTLSPKLSPPKFNNPFPPRKHVTEEYSSDDLFESESLLKVLEEESNVAVLPSHFSFGDVCTSIDLQNTHKANEQMAYTSRQQSPAIVKPSGDEANLGTVKGQNLKWKIIIKHHDDDEDDTN